MLESPPIGRDISVCVKFIPASGNASMPRHQSLLEHLDVFVGESERLVHFPAVIPDLVVRSTVDHEDAVTSLRAQFVQVHITSQLVYW